MVHYTDRSKFQISTLRPQNRKRVEQTIKELQRWLENLDNGLSVRKLALPEDIYIASAGPSLRVFFQKDANGIEILDIVPQERIDAFHEAAVTTDQR